MRRLLLFSFLLILSAPRAPCATQESLTFGRFGTVVVYRESPHPSHVALFVSGDEGWSQTVSDKDKALLIGYSLGADVLPFMANGLSRQTLSRVQLVALLGPGCRVDFEFHLTNWFWDSPTKTARPVLPEVEKLRGTKTLCFYGDEERDTLCKDLAPSLAIVIPLKGGHHFDGDYQAIAETILQGANKTVQ